MEFIFEIVVELMGALYDWQANKHKPNKWIYYPLMLLNFLIFLGICAMIIAVGTVIFKENQVFGIMLLSLGLFLFFRWVYKYVIKRRRR